MTRPAHPINSVTRAAEAPAQLSSGVRLQRKCACGTPTQTGEECAACAGKRMQRRAAGSHRGVVVPGIVEEVLRSPGQTLDASTRAQMEARFGHDFGRVRVHADERASESARSVNAHAYTVGDEIVFAASRYAPRSEPGRRLLAHELAHVVQQRGAGFAASSEATHEAAADHAANAVAAGAPMSAMPRAGIGLARQEATPPPDAAARASRAELMCDLATLCQLRFSAPTVVNAERVRSAYRHCYPSAGIAFTDPCLMPNYGLPFAPGSATGGPSPTPGSPGATRTPSTTPGSGTSGSSGGLSLPSTTVRFSLGPAQFTIDLPASLAIRLPVPFRGAQQVVFALEASPSEFSFTVTINAVPHVRIIARAAATTSGTGSVGLRVETTRTTCQAVDEAAGRSALQSAGERLRDAIRAVQNPPPVAPDASELERTFAPEARLGEVVAAIANLNSEIERVRARCREVPVATFEFGAHGPLTTPTPGEEHREGSFIGGTATFHF